VHIIADAICKTRKAREVGVAYNGRANWPGQLWAARAGRGREKERLGPGQAGAAKKNGWARARPGLEKERLGLCPGR